MKKMLFFAVAVIMMTLCACSDDIASSKFGSDEKGTVDGLKLKKCEVISNEYSNGGVVTNVTIRRAPSTEGTPEGLLLAESTHQAIFEDLATKEEIAKTYTGTNEVQAYGVRQARYAREKDIFKTASIATSPIDLPDGREVYVVRFKSGSDEFSISLAEKQTYDTGTMPVINNHSFNYKDLCKNNIYNRRFVSSDFVDQNRDSADWHLFALKLKFEYELESGPDNVVQFEIHIPTLWIYQGGGNPDIPDNPRETVAFEDREKSCDYVNDTTSNSWMKIWRIFSDGTSAFYKKVEIPLKNTLSAPAYQVKTVSNLTYSALQAQKSNAVRGERISKPGNCFCYPYTETFTTRTDKCSDVFVATHEGSAYWVDSLGVSHEFISKDWSFADKGWSDASMSNLQGFERLLLTSKMTGSFNSHTHAREGKVELRKQKDNPPATLTRYEYEIKGLRTLEPMKKYFSYGNQFAVYSDGTRESMGEIGVEIAITVTPQGKQTVTVTDWNITDQMADTTTRQVNGKANDIPADNGTGTFTLQDYRQDFRTKTNKSMSFFRVIYGGKVTFKDKFGKVVEFPAIKPTYTDKGGVATLRALQDLDGYERKLMTTTANVKATPSTDNADYTSEVEFRKQKEVSEELVGFDHVETLSYMGNGKWNTVSNITYHWKVQGDKTEVVSQTIEWSLTGEGFKTITLDTAEDPFTNAFVRVNEGAWSSETSSAGTQTGVTVYTKTNSSISETYKHVTDKYTAKRQRAVLNKTVGGKTVKINLLAPTDMTFSHKTSSLVDGGETTDNGTKYHVWKHTGNLVANVTASNDTRSESGTVKKDIRVKMEDDPIIPDNPDWGNPVKLMGATLVYHPGVGNSAEGAFHKNLIIKYEKGILVVTTKSFGQEANNWNPMDFSYESSDFYFYGSQYWGRTLTEAVNVNSALLRDGKWEPALITMDGTGWVYKSLSGAICNMDQNLAITAGIKNFNTETTAENNPFLNWSGRIENGVLNIYNAKGVKVISFR